MIHGLKFLSHILQNSLIIENEIYEIACVLYCFQKESIIDITLNIKNVDNYTSVGYRHGGGDLRISIFFFRKADESFKFYNVSSVVTSDYNCTLPRAGIPR
jgi:hypothetical protein